MPKALMFVGALMATLGAAVAAWRRDRRMGSAFVNTLVNPLLLRRGLAGGTHSEIGPLEHVGRKSGIRRLTPVHPEATPDGFRVMVPLGERSEWARNVLTAGHCRVQLHGQVYDLTDPQLVPPQEVSGLPRLVRRVTGALGFRYLTMRTVGLKPGTL
jgi:deazaflavin-dependent oxidoreductase (nitroreductase family)